MNLFSFPIKRIFKGAPLSMPLSEPRLSSELERRRSQPIIPTFHYSNIPITERNGFKLILLLILFLWPWTPVMADDSLATILKGVQKRYGPLPGLAVSYEREVITRSMAMLGMQTQKDLASGMIYFRPPNSLKVQQETPDPEVVIINKDTLWWYIPRKKQVYKYPSHTLGQEMQLLSDIFQGLQQVESRFKVTLIADHTDMGAEIKLEPDPPWEQIDHIKLWIDPGNYDIRIIEIHNYLGGLTRFTLGKPSARDEFDENFFNFLVPEGVTVIEE